jgi:hypothetical protein
MNREEFERQFVFVEFRDSVVGRQAYIQGSTLAVWEVAMLLRCYAHDVPAVANHLCWSEVKVQAAQNYAQAFPEEIEQALAENDAMDFESLKRMLPQIVQFNANR